VPFPAAYSAEPAERPGERIHAGLCQLSIERMHIGELSHMQLQGGGQPFSVEPELQMCHTCSADGWQIPDLLWFLTIVIGDDGDLLPRPVLSRAPST
jgi:hypothetical protein